MPCSADPDVVRKFLAATARGFELAAAQPQQAAALLLAAVAEEHASKPLPVALDAEMVQQAQVGGGRGYWHTGACRAASGRASEPWHATGSALERGGVLVRPRAACPCKTGPPADLAAAGFRFGALP